LGSVLLLNSHVRGSAIESHSFERNIKILLPFSWLLERFLILQRNYKNDPIIDYKVNDISDIWYFLLFCYNKTNSKSLFFLIFRFLIPILLFSLKKTISSFFVFDLSFCFSSIKIKNFSSFTLLSVHKNNILFFSLNLTKKILMRSLLLFYIQYLSTEN